MMVESGFTRVAGFTCLFSEIANSGMVANVATAVVDVAEVEVVVDEVEVLVNEVEVLVDEVEVLVDDVEVVVAEVEVVVGTLVDDVEVEEVFNQARVEDVEATLATMEDSTTSLPRINFMFSAKLFPLFTFDHAESASQREIPPKLGLLIISLVKYFETVLGSA